MHLAVPVRVAKAQKPPDVGWTWLGVGWHLWLSICGLLTSFWSHEGISLCTPTPHPKRGREGASSPCIGDSLFPCVESLSWSLFCCNAKSHGSGWQSSIGSSWIASSCAFAWVVLQAADCWPWSIGSARLKPVGLVRTISSWGPLSLHWEGPPHPKRGRGLAWKRVGGETGPYKLPTGTSFHLSRLTWFSGVALDMCVAVASSLVCPWEGGKHGCSTWMAASLAFQVKVVSRALSWRWKSIRLRAANRGEARCSSEDVPAATAPWLPPEKPPLPLPPLGGGDAATVPQVMP